MVLPLGLLPPPADFTPPYFYIKSLYTCYLRQINAVFVATNNFHKKFYTFDIQRNKN